jgi:hypothetical protein
MSDICEGKIGLKIIAPFVPLAEKLVEVVTGFME